MTFSKTNFSLLSGITQLRIVSLLLSFLVLVTPAFAQVLPSERSTDWSHAGLKGGGSSGFKVIDMSLMGAVGDSITPNDSIIKLAVDSAKIEGGILQFPAGKFLFNRSIFLYSNVVIRGAGSASTEFITEIPGQLAHSIIALGETFFTDTSALTLPGTKNEFSIEVGKANIFSPGDWIQIVQTDDDLVTSNWAEGSVGQITRISSIDGSILNLDSPLRLQYNLNRRPFVRRLQPIENTGIECVKLLRRDDDAPNQVSNVYMKYVVNSWIRGVESENCTFSHFEISNSSNVLVHHCYAHHAFAYSVGGQAYGVILDSTSNECVVENSIFEHLRHSILLQAGANGNVIAFNYSFDPHWSTNPSNSAGELVLHGNYPYLNLFEQNVVQNIVIDNSHGPNGPFNTFLRNRAEGYGIFFSAANSPSQNFIGNDISNNTFPFNLVNYTLQGDDHFLYGNNNKGTIDPPGTEALSDNSYGYESRPQYLTQKHWASIGTPNSIGTGGNNARDRSNQTYIDLDCGESSVGQIELTTSKETSPIKVYPNPTTHSVTVENYDREAMKISISAVSGIEVNALYKVFDQSAEIDLSSLPNGIYFIGIVTAKESYSLPVIKH